MTTYDPSKYPFFAVNHPDALADFEQNDELILQSTALFPDVVEQQLVERLYRRSGHLDPGTELYDKVAIALEPAELDEAIYRRMDAGIGIAQTILEQFKPVRARVLAFLAMCHEIDRIKVGYTGYDGDATAMNTIQHYARLTLAQEIDPIDKNIDIVWQIESQLKHGYEHNWQYIGWFIPKASLLVQDLQTRQMTQQTLGVFTPHAPKTETIKPAEVESQAKLLMAHALEQRKYGIKPAYIDASIGGAWVFYDPFAFSPEMREEKNRDKVVEPMVAAIVHTSRTDLRDLRMGKLEEETYGKGIIRHTTGALRNLEPDLILHLSTSGELFIDSGGWRRLREEIGYDSSAYSQILSEIVSDFHDLCVPVELIRKAGLKNITQLQTTKPPKNRFNPIMDMLLPRIKAYQQPNVEDITHSEVPRIIREHQVIWHIRILPEGWHASPEAQANAARLGIQLGPHETFVREHMRGSDNPVTGHRAVRRLIDSTFDIN